MSEPFSRFLTRSTSRVIRASSPRSSAPFSHPGHRTARRSAPNPHSANRPVRAAPFPSTMCWRRCARSTAATGSAHGGGDRRPRAGARADGVGIFDHRVGASSLLPVSMARTNR